MPRIQLRRLDPETLQRLRRQSAYMKQVAERAAAVREARRAALRVRAEDIRLALDATARLSKAGGHPLGVNIRQGYVWLTHRRELPEPDSARDPQRAADEPGLLADAVKAEVETRPPLTRLLHRPGRAVTLHLISLFVAACEAKPGSVPRLAPTFHDRTDGWPVLIADRSANPRARRQHLSRALDRLDEVDVVELARPGTHRRYDDFKLRLEHGRGGEYKVAGDGPGVIPIPAAFFLNGWHLVLTNAEIATWLMFRRMARHDPRQHTDAGLWAVRDLRMGWYGISDEVYETHHELTEFGLLKVTDPMPGRKAGRGVPAEDKDGSGGREAFRVQVVDDPLRRSAVQVVARSLNDPLPYHLRKAAYGQG